MSEEKDPGPRRSIVDAQFKIERGGDLGESERTYLRLNLPEQPDSSDRVHGHAEVDLTVGADSDYWSTFSETMSQALPMLGGMAGNIGAVGAPQSQPIYPEPVINAAVIDEIADAISGYDNAFVGSVSEAAKTIDQQTATMRIRAIVNSYPEPMHSALLGLFAVVGCDEAVPEPAAGAEAAPSHE